MLPNRRLLRRLALAVLLACSLGLLTVYYREPESGSLHGAQQASILASLPVRDGIRRITKPFRDLASWIGDISDARTERDRLAAENARLRAALAQRELNAQDAAELELLVRYVRSKQFRDAGSYTPRTARVIARSGSAYANRVLLDAGRAAGIRVGDPVLAAVSSDAVPEGAVLVGRVTDARADTAVVTLVDDPAMSVGATVAGRRGADGIVQPNAGDASTLVLDFVQKSAEVEPGDLVVTSGFSKGDLRSWYPRGLEIGTVTSARNTDTETYKQIVVTPWVDLGSFTFALVLTGGGAAPQIGAGAATTGGAG